MMSKVASLSRSSSRASRFPEFFIVGHPKSGTTALYKILRQHPQIFMPSVKEPEFFSRDLSPGSQSPSLDGYLSLFDPAEPTQIRGEASVLYLRSRIAASRIAEVRPDAKIIAILREPASFIEALHLEFLRTSARLEREDLRTAMALEHVRRTQAEATPAACSPLLLYSDYVRYVDQLRRYHAAFPREQVLILIYDDFRGDNDAVVRQIYDFLAVDATAAVPRVNANPSVSVRSHSLNDWLYATAEGRKGSVLRAVKFGTKMVTTHRVRRRLLEVVRQRVVYGPPPPRDEDVMGELRQRFSAEVFALSEYLDRDLTALWGYTSTAGTEATECPMRVLC